MNEPLIEFHKQSRLNYFTLSHMPAINGTGEPSILKLSSVRLYIEGKHHSNGRIKHFKSANKAVVSDAF